MSESLLLTALARIAGTLGEYLVLDIVNRVLESAGDSDIRSSNPEITILIQR